MVPASFARTSASTVVTVIAGAVAITAAALPPVVNAAGMILQVCWLYIVTGTRG